MNGIMAPSRASLSARPRHAHHGQVPGEVRLPALDVRADRVEVRAAPQVDRPRLVVAEGGDLVERPGASLSTTSYMTRLIDESVELLTGERPPVAVERVLAALP